MINEFFVNASKLKQCV